LTTEAIGERDAPSGPAAAARVPDRDRGERLRECRRRLTPGFQLERRVVAEHDAWLCGRDRQRWITADDGRPAQPQAPIHWPRSPRRINVTDPDSRNLKTTRGWVQGYNAQAVVTAEQIVLAAEISTESLD
jgi:hypothetical protein